LLNPFNPFIDQIEINQVEQEVEARLMLFCSKEAKEAEASTNSKFYLLEMISSYTYNLKTL